MAITEINAAQWANVAREGLSFSTLLSLLNTKTITNRFFCIVLLNRHILYRLLQYEFYLVMVTVSVGLVLGLENFLCPLPWP